MLSLHDVKSTEFGRICRRASVSVLRCVGVCFNCTTSGRILIKFDIRGPYENLRGDLGFHKDMSIYFNKGLLRK